ncbi:hypothetical protein [Peredibacter starrii]|uniref:Lipoprotein n=1 Tax=Peredibacter starrii TaxID=28202 RepID=A0AAX4HVE7_9BACT|nr:hypothetical protein [Peredibacter starrii]WPU67137.1 hypothetical protein SOO65_10265 [Peredibacter starrii]
MKFASLLVLLALTAACGKEGGGSGRSSVAAGQPGVCNLNGRSVACESIRGADGLGIDLLETMVDAPIQVTDSEIQFLGDKESLTQGRRIECRTNVKSGETYRYTLRGQRLLIDTESGSYEMTRLNSGEGLIGTWVWKGYVDGGTHIIRQFSFLGNDRVIIRTNCEL